jgi:hypothetical protein
VRAGCLGDATGEILEACMASPQRDTRFSPTMILSISHLTTRMHDDRRYAILASADQMESKHVLGGITGIYVNHLAGYMTWAI